MKRTIKIFLILTILFFNYIFALTIDKYAWETYRVHNIDIKKTAALLTELNKNIDEILEAGIMAPIRLAYADIPREAYWLYYERGRIITTLAYAYPHLDKERQQQIKTYVNNLLASKTEAPWINGIKNQNEGTLRELHKMGYREGTYYWDKKCPLLHTIYGLWLWGDRSGDWTVIKNYWPDIKKYYNAHSKHNSENQILYGQMSAHIAIVRLSKHFKEEEMLKISLKNLEIDLNDGKNISNIYKRMTDSRFHEYSNKRNQRYFPGQLWLVLNSSPEIWRFFKNEINSELSASIESFKEKYPKWWLHQAPYFTRWTGDEGVGLTSETFSIIFPYELWIKDTNTEKLALFMRSQPTGTGDCYWLEALVWTIESFGKISWEKIN